MRISSAAFALAALCSHAQAAGVTDAVPGHPGVTFEDLLRQAMPALTKNDDGTWDSGPLHHFRGLDGKPAVTEDKPPKDLEIAFGSLDTLTVHEDGHRRLLVLAQGNSGGTGFDTVLAAFDDERPTPKFLDYIDAGRDQFNGIGEIAALGGGTDFFAATSTHSNSNQSYEFVTPVYLRGGKFQPVATFFVYGISVCSYATLQNRSFTMRPRPGAPYGDMIVSIAAETTRGDADCNDAVKPPRFGKTVVSDVYRWNAKTGAFVAKTGAVQKLSDKNWKAAG